MDVSLSTIMNTLIGVIVLVGVVAALISIFGLFEGGENEKYANYFNSIDAISTTSYAEDTEFKGDRVWIQIYGSHEHSYNNNFFTHPNVCFDSDCDKLIDGKPEKNCYSILQYLLTKKITNESLAITCENKFCNCIVYLKEGWEEEIDSTYFDNLPENLPFTWLESEEDTYATEREYGYNTKGMFLSQITISTEDLNDDYYYSYIANASSDLCVEFLGVNQAGLFPEDVFDAIYCYPMNAKDYKGRSAYFVNNIEKEEVEGLPPTYTISALLYNYFPEKINVINTIFNHTLENPQVKIDFNLWK